MYILCNPGSLEAVLFSEFFWFIFVPTVLKPVLGAGCGVVWREQRESNAKR